MKPAASPWLIVGQGLAGTCLAWQMWWRGMPFDIVDDDRGGSSRVAAGLINPITGKNFEPTPDIAHTLPETLAFYQKTAARLGAEFWHPLPILRLASTAAEWAKIQSKLTRSEVTPWVSNQPPKVPFGFHGAVAVTGGGRFDTRGFLDASRAFFSSRGIFRAMSHDPAHTAAHTIFCDGAAGLLTGRTGPHRCAKGEILTLCAPDWPQDHIRIGGGGWLIPLGESLFKAGATYTWDRLDSQPTAAGREKVESIARTLGGPDFEVIAHEAGIRPIIRRSRPLIGSLESGHWIFNGLGSKGALLAPATARLLADCLESGTPPGPEHDIREFLKKNHGINPSSRKSA